MYVWFDKHFSPNFVIKTCLPNLIPAYSEIHCRDNPYVKSNLKLFKKKFSVAMFSMPINYSALCTYSYILEKIGQYKQYPQPLNQVVVKTLSPENSNLLRDDLVLSRMFY